MPEPNGTNPDIEIQAGTYSPSETDRLEEQLNKEMRGQRVLPKKDAPKRWFYANWGMLGEPDPLDWLIKDYISLGSVTLFTGAGGLGKSLGALQLTADVASMGDAAESGDSWLGPSNPLPVLLHGQVIFASWEASTGDTRRQLSLLSKGRTSWIRADLPIWLPYEEEQEEMGLLGASPLYESGPYGLSSMTNSFNNLRTMIEECNAEGQRHPDELGPVRLVVLDSLAAVFSADENNRQAVRDFGGSLWRMAGETNVAVLLIAHPPKDKRYSYSGSTDWQANTRAMWSLTRKDSPEDDKAMELTRFKSNFAEDGLFERTIEVTRRPGYAFMEATEAPGQNTIAGLD